MARGRLTEPAFTSQARANRIDGNTASLSNDRGIDVDAVGNLVAQRASLNATNYDIVPGNANANIETPAWKFRSGPPVGKLHPLGAS